MAEGIVPSPCGADDVQTLARCCLRTRVVQCVSDSVVLMPSRSFPFSFVAHCVWAVKPAFGE